MRFLHTKILGDFSPSCPQKNAGKGHNGNRRPEVGDKQHPLPAAQLYLKRGGGEERKRKKKPFDLYFTLEEVSLTLRHLTGDPK